MVNNLESKKIGKITDGTYRKEPTEGIDYDGPWRQMVCDGICIQQSSPTPIWIVSALSGGYIFDLTQAVIQIEIRDGWWW
jgi:hypothetical protein